MASKTNRARRLERARAERRMARLAAQQRQRRRIQAGIGGAVALVLIALGTTWLLGGFSRKPQENAASPTCTWTARQPVDSPDVTGQPPTTVPTTGVRTIIVTTNLGEIRGVIDVASAFCAAASVDFLAQANFYNDSTCPELDTNLRTITCGERTPSYQFPTEGLPRDPLGTVSPEPDLSASPGADLASYYLKGSIVLDNVDVNAVGAALMFVYGDGSPLPAEYTQIGTVTSGMEILEQVAAAGAVDDTGVSVPAGKPAEDLKVLSVTLTDDLSQPGGSESATPDTAPTAASDTPTAPTSSAPTS